MRAVVPLPAEPGGVRFLEVCDDGDQVRVNALARRHGGRAFDRMVLTAGEAVELGAVLQQAAGVVREGRGRRPLGD